MILSGIISFKYKVNNLHEWADKNSYTIESYDIHMTTINTPFYYLHDDQTIFDVWVKTSENNKEHWWIRKGVFTDDYIKEKKKLK